MMDRRQHRSKGDHLAIVISSLALACMGAMLATVIITAFIPMAPLSRLLIGVVNKPVVAGDLHIQIDYCKRSNMPPHEVRWALVDGVAIMLPPYVITLPQGCHVVTVAMPLSRAVAPGVYTLQVTGIYRPWPWREVVYTRQSAPFRLLPEGSAP